MNEWMFLLLKTNKNSKIEKIIKISESLVNAFYIVIYRNSFK